MGVVIQDSGLNEIVTKATGKPVSERSGLSIIKLTLLVYRLTREN
jgi:hypothetical protein